jgi:hypothetical protein
MKRKLSILSLLFLLTAGTGFACTTAVISGKATKDGRPMLWKNRDTGALNNKIMIFHDGKYVYTGLVNSHDKTGKSIWIGYNSAGFAIMNSASYNLNNDTIRQTGGEGRLMKRALQTCATVDDFEKLLNSLPRPIRLEANFGVIDAKGGAAYFEVGNFKVFKIDANDQAVAPDGYLIRTNYSFMGTPGKGGGYIRYVSTQKVLEKAVYNGGITIKTIMQDATKNLHHSLTGTNLWDYVSLPAGHQKMVWFRDYVPRRISASSCMVQGVKPGQNAALTTMWTDLGWPLASVTIPVILSKQNNLPSVLQYDKKLNDAPLCHFALALKDRCYTYKWGTSSKYYMNVNALLNADKTGILQILEPLDSQLIAESEKRIKVWEKAGKVDTKELKTLYDTIDNQVRRFYKEHFNLME